MEYKLDDPRFTARLYLRGQDRLAVKIEYPDVYHERVKQFLRELVALPQDALSGGEPSPKTREGQTVAA